MKGVGLIGVGTRAGDEDSPERTYDHKLLKRALRYLRPSAGLVVLATVLAA